MSVSYKIRMSLPNVEQSSNGFSFRIKYRSWNEQCEYTQPKKMFIISDIEGNFRSFHKLLMKAKVIDKYFHWIFKDNHLVIVGDCFDRGEEVTECLWLIYSLEEKAKKDKGHVHFILGNHEIMNMNGDWRYVHPKYAQRTNGSATALYGGNNELWRWLRTKNIIEKIGDILFVHAGVAIELVQQKLSVNEINDIARPYYTKAGETFTDPTLSLLYGSDTSPFWYRGYYLGTASEEQIDATLNHFKVKTIVTGHTIVSRVDSFYNGKVINVNTNHVSGNSEGLLISRNKFYRVPFIGKKEQIK